MSCLARVAAASRIVTQRGAMGTKHTPLTADSFHVSRVGLTVGFSAPITPAFEVAVAVKSPVPGVVVREGLHSRSIRRLRCNLGNQGSDRSSMRIVRLCSNGKHPTMGICSAWHFSSG